jgi:hypothetical protein
MSTSHESPFRQSRQLVELGKGLGIADISGRWNKVDADVLSVSHVPLWIFRRLQNDMQDREMKWF